MARSALAPKLRTLLQQAVRPDEDDALSRSVDDILHALERLKKNRERYGEADMFYDGLLGMVWASDRVQQILSRQGGLEEIKDFNYAAIPVDRIAARLQISSVVAAPADENEGQAKQTEEVDTSTATKAIARLRKTNELDAEEKRLHHEASKYGVCYLLVWPGEDDDGNATVDMRVNSPHNVVMIYDEEDQLRPRYALKSWDKHVDGKTVVRANLYYPDRIERWTTEPGGNAEKDDGWFKLIDADPDSDGTGDFGGLDDDDLAEIAADEFTDPDEVDAQGLELGDIPNPWGRVPFFHFRNDRPDGKPEHLNAYGPQQLINKLVWGLAAVIDYTTFPQRYILMDPSLDDPMQNLSDPDHPDLEDDDLEDEGGNAGLDASPGAVWKLWGKSTGEFSAANPDAFLASLDRIVRSMAELTGLPVNAFSRSSADIPSGESLREANADFIAIIDDRQNRYDPVWQDAYEFALKMLNVTNVTIDVRWKPAQMVNDLAGWQVVQAKITAGVPPKVALEEAGYPPEQVDEWLTDATGADLGRRVALLNQIATATQALGASIVTGAVSATQVQAIIAALFKDTLAGTDHTIPAADDFVDPQAALKAQQEMQSKQFDHAKQTQDAQLDHATQTQQASQSHSAQMAADAHQRMRETMQQAGSQADNRIADNGNGNGRRRGRGPTGPR
jgi:hypothetical protein